MSDDFATIDERTSVPRRRPLLAYLLLPGLFFLLGLGAMGWLLSSWDAGARMIGIAPEPAPEVQAAPVPLATVERQTPPSPASGPADTAGEPERIVIDPDVTRRVAVLEQR